MSKKDTRTKNIGKRVGNTKDLPETLLKEIRVGKLGTKATKILEVLKYDLEGAGSLDEIMVAYYRRYNEVYARKSLQQRIHKLKAAGILYRIKGMAGCYALTERKEDAL